MKTRRKFLQMLDVRVRQSLSGHRPTSTSSLHRVHSIESLATEHADFKAFSPVGATAEISSL
jgi:hypothetical protein